MDILKEIIEPYNLLSQEYQVLEGYASINYRIKSNGKNYLLKYYTDPDEYQFENSII